MKTRQDLRSILTSLSPNIVPILRLQGTICFAVLVFMARSSVSGDTAVGGPLAIPLPQIKAMMETQYSADGLSVSSTNGDVRLSCVFQRIKGELTHEGVWL